MAKATDSAPAYEELYHNHPVNQHPPSGSSSAYAPVPLEDDTPSSAPLNEPQTPLQDLNAARHAHCEACEERQDRKERRQHEKRICGIVAATFMVAFICLMIVGIVSIDGWYDAKRKSH
ncbi:hypothetical protein MMC11_003378 [Xylographa trunciseda]|nr:hypothetical protein [Xylographa trunciseda]